MEVAKNIQNIYLLNVNVNLKTTGIEQFSYSFDINNIAL